MSTLSFEDAAGMLAADPMTVPELLKRLEEQRQATHDLVVLLDPREQRKFAPCADAEFTACPLRCAYRSCHAPSAQNCIVL